MKDEFTTGYNSEHYSLAQTSLNVGHLALERGLDISLRNIEVYFDTAHFLKLVNLDILTKTITNAPFVVDEAGAGGVAFELAAEVADIEA